MNKTNKNTLFAIIIVIAMLFWGGSWTSGKLVTKAAASEVVIFWRFFITFISFIPVIIYMKEPLKINKIGILQVVLGTIFLVLYNVFFLEGVNIGLAGNGGVIVTTLNPVFTFLISAILFRKFNGMKEVVGLALGLIGGAILFEIWDVTTMLEGGHVFFLFAALSWAIVSILSQKSKQNMSAFVFSFYIYGLSAVVDLFLALPKGVFNITEFGPMFWANVLYLSLGATTFGTTAYIFAASKLGANKASSFTFIVPTSALIFSLLLLGEEIAPIKIIGGLIALIAVYIINYKSKKDNPKLLNIDS